MANNIDTKKCSKCLCIKKHEFFGNHKYSKDGLKRECIECRSKATIKNIEKQNEWRKNNKLVKIFCILITSSQFTLQKNETDLKNLNHYSNLQRLTIGDHIEKTKSDMIKKRGL